MMDVVAIFLAWLDRTLLPVRVVVTDSKSNHVNFGIEGWNCLEGRLNDGGIDVFAVRRWAGRRSHCSGRRRRAGRARVRQPIIERLAIAGTCGERNEYCAARQPAPARNWRL